ncbi:MAG: Ku protein [Candidatus Tectomicrobia bacterium]|uniref:Non-homologous end joining protein Ku n=1 Tax=Tectimicrobiota bacterium TaxID=2528274 RepID=A0A932HZE1_UNCTE|nr:Ku protein [Candidatus Tectomicrobia bacterium]
MPRSIWSGNISFGLVNIPVKLQTVVREKSVRFHLLNPDGSCRLRRKLYCPETGEEYDFNETARGYEIAPDQYILMDEKELKKLRPDEGRSIAIDAFIRIEEVDPVYFDKPYYLVPDENAAKAYSLLLRAMEESKTAAIAHFVMRERQHLSILRPRDGAIVLHAMHYSDEVAEAGQLDIPRDVKPAGRELDIAMKLINEMTTDFDPSRYRDEYREELEKLIEAKAEGKEFVTAATAEGGGRGRVVNLMEALQRSLREKQGGRKEPRARRPSRAAVKPQAQERHRKTA